MGGKEYVINDIHLRPTSSARLELAVLIVIKILPDDLQLGFKE